MGYLGGGEWRVVSAGFDVRRNVKVLPGLARNRMPQVKRSVNSAPNSK